MQNFDRAFAIVVGEEGEYSDDPQDRGNWTSGQIGVGEFKGTKYGIAAHVYPHLDIKNLTLDEAKRIYLIDYWMKAYCHDMRWQVALPVFDSAVNQGVGAAIRMLQDALGVMVDGIVGPRTKAAIANANDRHVARFMARRVFRYQQHAKYERYKDGWLTRCFIIAREAA